MTTATKTTLHLVFTRAEGCCERCEKPITGQRGLDFSFHHRRPRGSGGSTVEWVNLPANIILLCGSGVTGCHGWTESHREASRDLGFLVLLNGHLIASEVPIQHALYGLVRLTDDGSVVTGPAVF